MTPADPLHALAAYCGIADAYEDIWDRRHLTSDATRRALLAAMGLPIHDGDPAALLATLEDDEWRRPLPPVTVVPSGGAIRLPVSLPADTAATPLSWTLRFEDGATQGGEVVPAQLTRLGVRRVDGRDYVRVGLELPPVAATGYHRIELAAAQGAIAAMPLIVAPHTCYLPPALEHEGRVWGPAVQLYGLRSRRNWGIGDFTDLRHLVDIAADAGAGIVGLNPLHELFPDDPAHISPYSPSSRAALATLYLDVEALPEFGGCATAQALVASERFQARLRALRAAELVDYPAVAAAKHEALEPLYRHFREHHLAHDTEHARTFRRFCDAAGATLTTLARYEALQAHFRDRDAGIWGWPVWPQEYRDPAGAAVAAFAAEHAEEVDFHAWLQWGADRQLAAAGSESWRRGLGVGLYADLAVGVNPAGAEAWAGQATLACGAYAGAPPDEFNRQGQNWGLLPYAPRRLRDAAYAPLIDVLRANMRHAGALRIDHAMALTRMFWVPADGSGEGAYVAYPLADLIGIVALESQRNRCTVIGEALGTVPKGFRARLARAGFLSYRPFFLERDKDGDFMRPADYPPHALAAVSTHDLPTLAGFWRGSDIDLRAELQLLPSPEVRETLVVGRAQDRARLLLALDREGLLPAGLATHPVAVPEMTPALIDAVHTHLARSPAQVLVVQPEDLLGIAEQANLPGSREDRHPNWRRKLTLDLDDWRGDARFARLGEIMRRERGSAAAAPAAELPPPRAATIPRATYRLQFNRDFGFAQAADLVPYLAELGISHCYASPYLKARPGSGHGYDVVDHATLNPEIGSVEDYERFVAALHAHGMGQIADVVPNHMGVMGADNAWWLDVLENGPASAHGAFFDIDWESANPELRGKVLLPLLGGHYGKVLDGGELRLAFDAGRGELSLYYYEHRLPLDPATYPLIVGRRIERLAAALGAQDERLVELQALLNAFARLPGRLEAEPERQAERQRDKEVHKRRLAALYAASADIAHHVDACIAELNGRAGEAASFDALHELIRAQGYRLAYWRVAADEINYRRFFDINDLAALRMEEPAVFEATHRYLMELLAQGRINGLRVDHPDGLQDPRRYFARLQERAGGRPPAPGEPLPLYLVVEKILAEHERLPADWPIHGATGYRFANLANALLVDANAERRMTRIYDDFVGERRSVDEIAHAAKRLIMETALAGELGVLAHRLARIAAASRDTCDFTANGLRDALAEVVACFPVYRTYVGPEGPAADDRRHIEWAVAVARRRSPAADASLFDFIQGVLTTDIAQGRDETFRAAVLACAMKFQQYSAPVMAKGLEDTAFYRYHRLVSFNDVGGDPRRFGVSVAVYHAATRARQKAWPHNLLATSTHDSKRAEDVRARIDVLSEMPAAWKLMLRRWARINRSRKRKLDGMLAPDANDEYLLYQTLVGTWPLAEPKAAELEKYRARIAAYMQKAVREAKLHSGWLNPNAEYEAALADFVAALLGPGEQNLFLADFVPAVQRIARHGLVNSLALTLLKLTAPGVPDIYQGCELWQFNLVDPDNRRPVDYELRRRLLGEVQAIAALAPEERAAALHALTADMSDGRAKLYLIRQALALRARHTETFRDGDYLPLAVRGEHAEHVCAFARRHGDAAIIAVVPRLTAKLCGGEQLLPLGEAVWGATQIELPGRLAQRRWTEILTGHEISFARVLRVADLCSDFPVALLASN